MKGKKLKVFNNDLYGKVDERNAIVFAAFIHKKYMNKYAIFTFENEYHKNRLNYGSIHIKENSLVIFKVRQEYQQIFKDFLHQYTSGHLVDFELIDITNLNKIEIVGYNDLEYQQLILLDKISIPRPQTVKKENKQSNFGLKIIVPIIVLVIGAIGVYLYLNRSLFETKILICTRDSYNREIQLDYKESLTVVYDGKNNLKQYDVVEKYYFKYQSTYQTFKDEARHHMYFSGNDKSFKYNDKNLELQVTYQRKSDINDYSKMKYQLEQKGYNCTEGTYEE